MYTHYYFVPDNSFDVPVSFSPTLSGEINMAVGIRNGSARIPSSSLVMRMAMRISRARWFSFLRRVFHYQNGSRSDLGSNPFNSASWIMLEFIVMAVQIIVITVILATSREEKPVWPLRIWIVGYDLGCLLTVPLLYWRYRLRYATQRNDSSFSDVELQRSNEESRRLYLVNKSRTFLELFFAIWFVMGNVWVFDSRFGSFNRAPKLHVLCISLLSWNAISYSFPFLLFLFLCCCVPLISNLVGYNMSMGPVDRGASDDQISRLTSWRYKEADANLEAGNGAECNADLGNEISECCICLSKYRDREEVRQLPCSHMYHLRCVDQWLRIISCCPLCKQELER